MSIITTFPGIRDSVVYPFCCEIDHHIFRHVEFFFLFRCGQLMWWLCLVQRYTHISSRAFSSSRPTSKRLLHSYMSRCFQAPPKGTHALICKLHMETKWKMITSVFCSCTKIKSAGILSTFGQWGGVRARFCAPAHSRVVKNKKDKRLWTDYSRLEIMQHFWYDGTYHLSLLMELSKLLTSIMWCPICCRDKFHSYGVRRHLVNRARNDVLHKNKEKFVSICPAAHPRNSWTWPLQTTPHPRALRAGLVLVVARGF